MKKLFVLVAFAIALLTGTSALSHAQQTIVLQPGSSAMVDVNYPTRVTCAAAPTNPGNGYFKVCECASFASTTNANQSIYSNGQRISYKGIMSFSGYNKDRECEQFIRTSAQCNNYQPY